MFAGVDETPRDRAVLALATVEAVVASPVRFPSGTRGQSKKISSVTLGVSFYDHVR